MKLVGKHYDGLVVEDVQKAFGGEHVLVEVGVEKGRAFKGLVLKFTGGDYEETPFGTSWKMELFGKHRFEKLKILAWGRKNQKKLDAGQALLLENYTELVTVFGKLLLGEVEKAEVELKLAEVFGGL